jgi:hypothetical protein
MKGQPLDLSNGTKTCPRCKETLPLERFSKDKQNIHGYRVYCRKCGSERYGDWRKNNLPKLAAYSKQWRAENPRLAKDYSLQALYGVPLGTYDLLLTKQQGRCAICQSDNPGGRGDFHIDHCHRTKTIRGLLCHGCNVGIGSLQHSEDILLSAIDYLRSTEG